MACSSREPGKQWASDTGTREYFNGHQGIWQPLLPACRSCKWWAHKYWLDRSLYGCGAERDQEWIERYQRNKRCSINLHPPTTKEEFSFCFNFHVSIEDRNCCGAKGSWWDGPVCSRDISHSPALLNEIQNGCELQDHQQSRLCRSLLPSAGLQAYWQEHGTLFCLPVFPWKISEVHTVRKTGDMRRI